MSGEDEDRQAILRRRNRLIALALSGLGAAAGCDEAAPSPEPSELTAPEPIPEPVAPALVPIPPEVVELPDEPRVEPPPVDRAAEIRHAEEAKRQWQRRNARSVPCLSRIPPSVCLLMLKPDELDDPDPE